MGRWEGRQQKMVDIFLIFPLRINDDYFFITGVLKIHDQNVKQLLYASGKFYETYKYKNNYFMKFV
jgi:hypothetical protein